MKMMMCLAATAAMFALPIAAQAADGYVTCQAYQANKNRVLYTQAFAANKSDTDKLWTNFTDHLANNGFTKGMYDSAPQPVEGACNWESSAAAANKKAEGFKANYTAKGASTMGVHGFPN
jgi:hypothetical protein